MKASAAVLWIATAVVAGCVAAPPRQNYLARLELQALLQMLNADLLSHDSATLTLERWCNDHRLAESSAAEPVRIVARRLRDDAKPIPDELRTRLSIEPAEPIAYRHVQLICGTHVLSEADNWYVPGRLTAEMNQRLDSTDEPFGKVVKALGFQRRTIAADLLWSPLPPGWEMSARNSDDEPVSIPTDVLRHQAILYTSAQLPFSAVVETYTNQVLGRHPNMREGNHE